MIRRPNLIHTPAGRAQSVPATYYPGPARPAAAPEPKPTAAPAPAAKSGGKLMAFFAIVIIVLALVFGVPYVANQRPDADCAPATQPQSREGR